MGLTVDPLGVGLALLAAACQTTFILIAGRGFAPMKPADMAWWLVTAGLVVATLVLALVGDIGSLAGPLTQPQLWVWILFAGIAGAAIPTVWFMGGISRIGPSRTAILMTFEPLVGVTLAGLLLGEQPVPLQLVGGAAVVVAAVVLQTTPGRVPRESESRAGTGGCCAHARRPASPPAGGRCLRCSRPILRALRRGSRVIPPPQPTYTTQIPGVVLRVRKAVFPAAGWGTRFLPATKAQPKEMLPLVDRPVIQYGVEEAVEAGIEQVIIVTSSQKRAIEDHFDHSFELEQLLESQGRHRDAAPRAPDRRHGADQLCPPEGAARPWPRGADGQGAGRPRAVRRDPVGRRGGRRAAVHRPAHRCLPRTHASVVAVMEVPADESQPLRRRWTPTRTARGDDHAPAHGRGAWWRSRIAGRAQSNLAIIGRYVLTPKIFEKLEQTPHGAGGEIQLTDAIMALMAEQEVYAYEFEGRRYDAGTTMGWLKASVELALERQDIGAEFRRYLADLDMR